MQQLKSHKDYGAVTQQQQHQQLRHSESYSKPMKESNNDKAHSVPPTPLEQNEAMSKVGSEYYVSLGSASPVTVPENGQCNQIAMASYYCMPMKGDDPTNNHSSRSSMTFKRAIRKSTDAFLRSLGFSKNPVLPRSGSTCSVSSLISQEDQPPVFSAESSSSALTISTIVSSSITSSIDSTDSLIAKNVESEPLLSHKSTAITTTKSATKQPLPKLAKRNSSFADVRLSMASNFSAAYNTINISLALTLMKALHPPNHASDVSLCSSALIAGMIIGQLGGGVLGDWLGRHAAMAVVMSLQVTAAFWSGLVGLSGVGDGGLDINIYYVLAGWRFLLGVGCGGVYPLAATITAESSSANKESRGKLVALTFSMQGCGYLTVSLIAYFLVLALGEESDLAWRLLLGIGCIPGLGLICARVYHRKISESENEEKTLQMEPSHPASIEIPIGDHDNDKENQDAGRKWQQIEEKLKQVRLQPSSLFQQIRNEPNLAQKLLGTAGCWLLFDVLFYGNTLFQPVVLSAAFGTSETILNTVRDSTLISLMALPGYFVSVAMVGSQSPKRIQLQGFLIMAVLYTVIGLKFSALAKNRFALLSLYGLTFFFSNYGPNSTTFMMPSITFSRPCRSTLNGICAASGKLGALLGATLFVPLAAWLGNDRVMILCAVVSIVAAGMTLYLSDSVGGQSVSDVKPPKRVTSEAHLISIQVEPSFAPLEKRNTMPVPASVASNIKKVGSMPTFLDLK